MPTEDGIGSLLALASAKVRAKGPQCSLHILTITYPDKAAEIRELLDNTGERGMRLNYSTTAEALAEGLGTKIDGQTVSRHLRGKCGCDAA